MYIIYRIAYHPPLRYTLHVRDSKQETFTNPIIFADYSDPDVIRVGDIYYMTASSFNWTPGLPLLMSHNLVDWKLIGYASPQIPLPQFDSPRQSKGIWAPALRYHNGMFIITVGLPDEGIFVTQSKDFTGPWTPLRCIRPACGFIDPCPLWDDDGKAYIVHAYAKSRIGFNSRIGIFEINSDTLECIGEDICIFNGEKTQHTIEGPKIYKKDGWYHIFAPAGGVKQGWQTDLRSKNIMGPYEENIMLRQGGSHINGPHQGGLTDTPDGSWWFLHFQDRGIYGRVTLLEPAAWKDGWPYTGTSAAKAGAEVPGEPMDSYRMPVSGATQITQGIPADATDDDFPAGRPGLQWQWQANYKDTFILPHSGGGLYLRALPGETPGTKAPASGSTAAGIQPSAHDAAGTPEPLWNLPNLLTQKIVHENFDVVMTTDAGVLGAGSRTGLVFTGGQYASIGIEHLADGRWQLYYLESSTAQDPKKRTDAIKDACMLPAFPGPLAFRLSFRALPVDAAAAGAGTADRTRPSRGICTFSVETTAENIPQQIWTPRVPPYVPAGDVWVGGRIGMYASASGASEDPAKAGYAVITQFNVIKQPRS